MRNFARYERYGRVGFGIVDSERPGVVADFGDHFASIRQSALNDDSLHWTAYDDGTLQLLNSYGEEITGVDWADGTDTPSLTVEQLWAVLGEEANRRGWCSEYDDFAAKHGGPARPPRPRSWTAHLRIPVTFEGLENPEGATAELQRLRGEDRDALMAQLREGLQRRVNELGNDSVRYLTDYLSVLDHTEPGTPVRI